MTADTVAVVAVTYYSADIAGQFLTSLSATVGPSLEILLVDNTPEEGDLSELTVQFPEVSVVRPGRNLGYGGGINFGVARISDDVQWLVLANPDLVVAPDTIATLIDAAKRHPRAAALGPLIRATDGSVYPSARKLPSLRTGIGHALFVRIWPKNPWTASYRNDLATIDERAVGWLSGSFLLVRREAFEAIGGFDERYFMYFEDVDLCRNLGMAGWENYYIPTAEVVHHGALSTSRSARLMLKAHHESAYRYLAKRYRGWYLWPVRVVLRLGLKARSWIAKG